MILFKELSLDHIMCIVEFNLKIVLCTVVCVVYVNLYYEIKSIIIIIFIIIFKGVISSFKPVCEMRKKSATSLLDLKKISDFSTSFNKI